MNKDRESLLLLRRLLFITSVLCSIFALTVVNGTWEKKKLEISVDSTVKLKKHKKGFILSSSLQIENFGSSFAALMSVDALIKQFSTTNKVILSQLETNCKLPIFSTSLK